MALTSRSQARRLLNRLEKFSCVIFDFNGVSFIGQAFADEIFRVYRNKNTRTALQYTNTNEQIENIIRHVLRETI
ncbi:MAG: STAS-like domain-containing protein [Treponema sp.]|nr:STAS-like domain-containing protein [Treponema sp.]